MKQAILITAYKNYHHLEDIIAFFDDDFEIYIHIDRKSSISKEELLRLKKYDIVKLISQKYKVNWGGFNHLRSILYLSEKALKNPQNYYFHLISGNDFPIKKVSDFKFFFKNTEDVYIDCFDVPFLGWDFNGGLDRIEYYNLYDLFNWRNDFQKRIIKKIIHWQKKIGFKRKLSCKIPKIYGGSTWWSLSRECLNFVVVNSKENKNVFKRFKYTFCSEEFYFQTILMNSSFKDKMNKFNLRYIDWTNRNGNNPVILDEKDYEKILESDSFFARKFEYPVSEIIINKIKFILHE
ncbi:beta-1,6-N-acetylglucosaminyltransferase [Flavobacterium sp.]|uniref:beta-1,6-N-acetylglucosaminyltransferase n=1 Tax=Flavobacterium sp. TaxID=239 RepID=UPI0037529133